MATQGLLMIDCLTDNLPPEYFTVSMLTPLKLHRKTMTECFPHNYILNLNNWF